MKRLLLGLGCSLVASGLAGAQDPAARLGRPAGPVVRAQTPDFQPAAAFDAPRAMPRGTVAETVVPGGPPPLPSPTPVPTGPIPGSMVNGLPPGAYPTGPVLTVPAGPIMSPPVPTGPILTAPPVSGPFGYGGPFADQILGGPGGCSGNGCVTSPWYVGVEALAWWIESYDTPPLVTVGPATSGAFLTSPGANIAYGLNPVDTNPRYGARLTLGRWLNPKWAVELTAFYVRPRNDVFDLSSAQVADADLARPFFSLNTLTESSEIIGRPGVAVGSVHIESKSQIFGAELNARKRWWENCNNRIDLIAGVRYLYLEESLTITERVAGLAGATGFEGVAKQVEDRFTTKNRFWGAQIGAIFQHTRGPWTFELKAKVAAGVNREYTDVDGGIVPVVGGVPPGRPGGLLALASNIGEQRKDVFSWVPEVGLNVGYDVNSHCRVFLGYSVLYWSHAARPGNQIDPRLDENLIPYFPAAPPAQGFGPTPRVESESVWVQGVNFGVLFKW